MLLFKIFLAPVLIALISLAGRKWGPGVSGWLLGIPFNGGPILFFLALEQGTQFASRTAVGSVMGVLPWAIFALVYAHACRRLPWWFSTLIGLAFYFLIAALLVHLILDLVPVFIMVSISLAVILRAFPQVAPPSSPSSYHWYDLWLRMATASFMVVMLTGLAKLLGPMASGILSTFPAYTTILTVFSHHHEAAAAVHVLKGVVIGLYTFATFFLILSPSLLHLPLAGAFLLAIAGSLSVQGASLLYVRRHHLRMGPKSS